MENNILLILAVLGFLLEAGVLLAGAVWAVGQIKAVSEKLQATIDHHSSIISKLEVAISHLHDRVNGQGEDIARLEGGRK